MTFASAENAAHGPAGTVAVLEPAAEAAETASGPLRWLAQLGRLADAPGDTEQERWRKSTFLVTFAAVLFFCPIYAAIFFLIGQPLAALAPAAMGASAALGFAQLARDRQFERFRFRQILLILLMPFAAQWALGGFVGGSTIVVGAFLGPLAAVLFHGVRQSLWWYLAYLALLIASGVADPLLAGLAIPVAPAIRLLFSVMNIAATTLVVYLAVRYFALRLELEKDRQRRLNETLLERTAQLQESEACVRGELQRASATQQRLLPQQVPAWPGRLDIAWRFRSVVETSGDFYDVFPLPARGDGEQALQVVAADVAGKGMGAALVMSLTRSALRMAALVPSLRGSTAATLRFVGDRLYQDVGRLNFVCCALAVAEPVGEDIHLRVSNGGQVPVLLCRDGTVMELDPPGDRLPLGAMSGVAYAERLEPSRSGDVVVFSSDGLVEAPALADAAVPGHLLDAEQVGDLFSFDRFAQCAAYWAAHAETAEAVAEGIWSDVTAWCGPESHHDDMTLLVLRVPH